MFPSETSMRPLREHRPGIVELERSPSGPQKPRLSSSSWLSMFRAEPADGPTLMRIKGESLA